MEGLSAVEDFFHLRERGTTVGTELRAGLTTFMVMAYILFLNGAILTAGFEATGKADPHWDLATIAAGTALVAGVMTIAMGVVANYPFALAAGLGINAIVAFSLTGRGLSPAGAMGVIVLEGLLVTVLVVVGLREAIMNAVPVSLKRAIGVGIGLFILFIGFANGGLIKSNAPATLVTVSFPTTPAQWVFLAGLLITIVLYVMKIRAALVISILVTTVLALLVGVASLPEASKLIATPRFDTLGQIDLGQVFSALPLVTALLVIFTIMLTDFFDTMGTVTGVAAEAGLANPDGTVPNVGRPLLVDSLAAVAGGAAGVSSNTTYIESAAGVADGGRTGLTSVTTGVLFLLAILLSPIALIVPSAATAPALVLVGYLMFTLVRDIPVNDVEEGLPALLTMILMPLTYDITVGIGAGFISWVLIKVVRGKTAEIHWLMWLVAIAFLVFFAQDWITMLLNPAPAG
jgi:AGZA family xanthine/uracil permease-like MFS transporter